MEKKQDIVGYVGLGLSAVGAVVSVITNNIAPASLLLTVGVGCNVISRKQFNDSLVEAYNQQEETIKKLVTTLEANHSELTAKLMENQTDLANRVEKLQLSMQDNLAKQKENINSEITRLELQHQDLNNIVSNIKDLENISQELRSQPDSADFFYQRGLSYEKLGNYAGAIEDYTEAIKKNSSLSKAYHKRGVLYLDSGAKQKAVDDLRKAALLYFEQGDIESYHVAREMSRNIHELRIDTNGNAQEMIIGKKLFAE
ncbi:MAG: tetratricopeptide repeat protein [Cyanobacteria bacterium]|nr:tetratricopeptide repeat protein [Cyanobacteria bacterium CG_2015-16_32_12]NCO78295.1 tetratricopeptide repeat protein [Cyanobacteria bacterium CG_2015-22_32_23]NCQ02932.1 tetratricopeptide repeat protein [Cyanobacteria bacterium CG_2015-09_32_10]NCQ40983.1 tetratricopeptide repeat protein [Cyanobacteria bacterium CG_2015-04_32_10]NCS83521.1 tetratricopeptide repeat protein [Cyanobacteria bacterium CG_2015-02_32_10]